MSSEVWTYRASTLGSATAATESHRGNLGSYYGTGGAGYRDSDDTAY